jgi:hypothetical protein
MVERAANHCLKSGEKAAQNKEKCEIRRCSVRSEGCEKIYEERY